jgi:hypothetical protein
MPLPPLGEGWYLMFTLPSALYHGEGGANDARA